MLGLEVIADQIFISRNGISNSRNFGCTNFEIVVLSEIRDVISLHSAGHKWITEPPGI